MEMASDRHRFVLERPIVEPPGRRWHYCGGATALLGRLIVKGAQQTLPEFARQTLFEPLGIEAFEWMAGSDGVHSPASGLRLRPRDLARIGEVVLAHGVWRGRQVIPSEWLAEALSAHTSVGNGVEYGYQWYLGRLGAWRFAAGFGNGDQRLVVVPQAELVVAIAAGNYDTPHQGLLPQALLDEVVLPPSIDR
jgi:CubicO group peptidase (beta-lactamase class C family)